MRFLDRGYTGHEHLQGVGLINMNARLYDAKLHRFLAPDNFIQDPSNSQNYNRYGYVLNNPLVYTDPSGEYAIVDDIVAAVIGGVINLGVNIYQGNIKGDFWEVLGKGSAAFGAGAFSGWTALYPQFGGWVAGGAVVGATNSWLSGEDPIKGAVFGAVSGAVGGAIGSWASSGLSVVIQGVNISSPVLQGALGGALGGGTVGGIMNVGSAVISGADFSDAMGSFGQGFAMGAVTGAVSGAGGGYAAARQNGINPWTGKAIGSPAVDNALMPKVGYESRNSYKGVREASAFLIEEGVPRMYRKQVLQSFEIETISLKYADNNTFGLRFYGGDATRTGRYLFPTFTNYTNRTGLALPLSWGNSMTKIQQFQVRPGKPYIFGRAASQGSIYTGGSNQLYIHNINYLRL